MPKAPQDKTNPSSAKQPTAVFPRNKAIIVSVASSALLVTFALYTLFKTDFETFPDEGYMDLAQVTAQPEYLIENEPTSTAWDDDTDHSPLEEPQLPLDFAHDAPEMETPNFAEELATIEAQREELERQLRQQQEELIVSQEQQNKLSQLLQERDDVIAYLQAEYNEQRRRSEEITTALSDLDGEENIRPRYEALFQEHTQLKDSYSSLEQRYTDREASWRKSEQSIIDADASYHELSRRYEGTLRENAKLQDRITDDEQKFNTQEQTFRELRGALKGHKEALRRMDNARIELASELDATKRQYGKLLQAVADRAKEGGPATEIDALVATASAPIGASEAPAAQGDTRYHVVKKGDTLSGISRDYYGSAQRWHTIYEANQTTLTDHNRLKVGLVLVIP